MMTGIEPKMQKEIEGLFVERLAHSLIEKHYLKGYCSSAECGKRRTTALIFRDVECINFVADVVWSSFRVDVLNVLGNEVHVSLRSYGLVTRPLVNPCVCHSTMRLRTSAY
jgi:hypothetical protein